MTVIFALAVGKLVVEALRKGERRATVQLLLSYWGKGISSTERCDKRVNDGALIPETAVVPPVPSIRRASSLAILMA